MSDIVIRADNLSKRYRIGSYQPVHSTVRRQLATALAHPVDALSSFVRRSSSDRHKNQAAMNEYIWALKDVSFEVKEGEVVGIIGRNGAGKSTLLKILTRITEPTEGYAEIRGRVSSLLEVGTGFHPELTGRENVYLNGTILGMKKAEIDRKYDEIVEFAEVEKFMDTPVKRYSSGMRVRLGFAVAAHLEPEVMLVDEVLAVGDLRFQRKCLGRMGEMTGGAGKTILFVSHNMASIKRLCGRALLVDGGQVKAYGDTYKVVGQYEKEMLGSQNDRSAQLPIVNHDYGLILEDVTTNIRQENEHAHLQIEVQLKSLRRLSALGIAIRVYTYQGDLVARLGSAVTNNVITEINGKCRCVLECRNIEQFLASGEYLISVLANFPRLEPIVTAEYVASFQVPPYDTFGSGEYFTLEQNGVVPLPLKMKQVISS